MLLNLQIPYLAAVDLGSSDSCSVGPGGSFSALVFPHCNSEAKCGGLYPSPACVGLRLEDCHQFKATLGYRARLSQTKTQTKCSDELEFLVVSYLFIFISQKSLMTPKAIPLFQLFVPFFLFFSIFSLSFIY